MEDADATAVNRTKGRFVIPIPFNQERELIQDINIRRAISHAINGEDILNTAIGGKEFPAYDLVPGTPREKWTTNKHSKMAFHHDPEAARELLEEAGWTTSREREIRTRDGEELSVLFGAVDIGHYWRLPSSQDQY